MSPDDPRLTAHLLGELPPEESAAVVRAAAADPAVRIALRELEAVQRLLTNTLAESSHALHPHQRGAVLRAARQADLPASPTPLPSHRRSWKTTLIPLAAAAVIGLAVLILSQLPAPQPLATPKPSPPATPTWEGVPLEVALLPAPGPTDASTPTAPASPANAPAGSPLHAQTTARDAAIAQSTDAFLEKVAERLRDHPHPAPTSLPPITPRNSVPAISAPSLPLPILAGRASLGWIAHAIQSQKQLPDRNAVRLEEILNTFKLRPSTHAAVSQGVTLATESMPCPWKPSATLLILSFRGNTQTPSDITATFQADPAAVSLYRLLGFAPVTGSPTSPLPSRLPPQTTTTLALEIEPAVIHRHLGTIEWTVNGQPAPAVAITRHTADEPSDDARFAALLCTFAQWLAHEQPNLVDASLLTALANECSSPSLPDDRSRFLTLVQDALALQSQPLNPPSGD